VTSVGMLFGGRRDDMRPGLTCLQAQGGSAGHPDWKSVGDSVVYLQSRQGLGEWVERERDG
jgi:hypothetical protein